mgnify:CR=1 FL=1
MDTYLVYKSLHLIAVVSWMAGLLYLPRIFVYHAENSENISVTEVFKTMERKLYLFIMYPAMLLTWIFGLIMLNQNSSLLSAVSVSYKNLTLPTITEVYISVVAV